MSSHVIAICVLALMFIVATAMPINMGVIAFVGAFLVGTLVAGMETKTIMSGYPAELFLTLVGITFLFAQAQNNGTIDWLVRLAVRAVGGRIAAIPWVMFFITALLTSVGAVSPAAVAIIAPIALGFAAKYKINPLMMGLLVIHGAQGGGFSPISIYGGITNKVVMEAGLPISPLTTAFTSLGVNLAVSVLLFFVFGGAKLMRQQVPKAERSGKGLPVSPFGPPVAVAAQGPQIYGDAENESASEERLTKERSSAAVGAVGATGSGSAAGHAAVDLNEGPTFHQMFTVAGLVALAVLTLLYKLDIGFVAITIGLLISILSPQVQKRAIGQVSWPEIMLIVGVSTYVGVMQKMGTITWVGDSAASLASPLTVALLLLFVGAVVSAFASSTAVLGSLIPLAVPFLASGTGVDPIGFIAAMAVASTIVDVSPFSTNGALVLASAQGIDRDVFLRQLMIYGGIVTLVAPVVLWVLFVVF
ncbi:MULTISPECIES: SLC13 family permease [Massilia]|uniref:DeoR family transcriptional regulator n=1 Tax=Massilia aurea TaxID=373040 RepID=A0A422QH02_9BURK|nr:MULTISPECIES: SLC13 family permease [Massilia]MDY0961948.1 SLC13 family permease [Massilia sp. CFBP9026]RNF29231.1 DeoR family transcriptional regulator [Massilia aurea]